MALRIRIVDNETIALRAERAAPQQGDIYLSDGVEGALARHFARLTNPVLVRREERKLDYLYLWEGEAVNEQALSHEDRIRAFKEGMAALQERWGVVIEVHSTAKQYGTMVQVEPAIRFVPDPAWRGTDAPERKPAAAPQVELEKATE